MTPVALKQGAKGVLVSTYYTILKKKSSKLDILYAVEFFRIPNYIYFSGEHHRVLKKD